MHQGIENTLDGFGAITHFGFKANAIFHVVHCAGFSDHEVVFVVVFRSSLPDGEHINIADKFSMHD